MRRDENPNAKITNLLMFSMQESLILGNVLLFKTSDLLRSHMSVQLW